MKTMTIRCARRGIDDSGKLAIGQGNTRFRQYATADYIF